MEIRREPQFGHLWYIGHRPIQCNLVYRLKINKTTDEIYNMDLNTKINVRKTKILVYGNIRKIKLKIK